MPFQPQRYPPDWHAIARRVKDAAGWRCEQCGHAHAPREGYTLTVHHIDGDPQNNRDENLVALCQRCHLALHGKKNVVGQRMFWFAQPAWLRKRRK